jgi:hypothetical protein
VRKRARDLTNEGEFFMKNVVVMYTDEDGQQREVVCQDKKQLRQVQDGLRVSRIHFRTKAAGINGNNGRRKDHKGRQHPVRMAFSR